MYELVECLIIKDENQYLIEHLSHGAQSGIEHFYIYDNMSDTPVSDFLKKYDEENGTRFSNVCTVELFENTKYTQVDCYKKFISDHRDDAVWAVFIDTDELLEGSLIDLCRKNSDFLCLRIKQILHGANGHTFADPTRTMTELYKPHILKEITMVKCVSKLKYIKQQNPHHTIIDAPGIDKNKWLKNVYPSDGVELHHYFTKSFEEWLIKIKRGSVMSTFGWKLKGFFVENDINEKDRDFLLEKYGLDIDYRMKGNPIIGHTWHTPMPLV